MQRHKEIFWGLMALSTLLGVCSQSIFLTDCNDYPGFFNRYLGYTVIVPACTALLVKLVGICKLRNKWVIAFLGGGLFLLGGLLNVFLYPLFGGPTGEVYLILLFLVAPPAFLLGIFFGFLVATSGENTCS